MDLGIKVLRRLTYRYAERARLMQQAGAFALSEGESVAGRCVVVSCDGAHWIWNRVPSLIKNLGLLSSQVHELLDFYHAVEHLGSVAFLRKAWSAKVCSAWVRKQRRLLSKGQAEQVIAAVQAICKGRNGKAITTERDYFIRNQHWMAYPTLKALKLPLGSGAVVRFVG